MTQAINALDWNGTSLKLLDQRVLPHAKEYVICSSLNDVIAAIKNMVVRGAPAIGIAAAYAGAMHASTVNANSDWRTLMLASLDRLEQARPTAVNLMWAVAAMREEVGTCTSLDELVNKLKSLAVRIHEEDLSSNETMAQLGAEVLAREAIRPFPVLTHCNTGSLATGGWGTALGVIRQGAEQGIISMVYADETRPWLQGARLTAWELMQDGVPVTLNADSAAAWLMQNKGVRWVIVGADRITENGDVANKIGTYGLAIMARYHGCKFMVVAPSSTVDMQCASGRDIEIEMRAAKEVCELGGRRVAPENCNAVNPVFDVTPASLVDVIVTEKGVISQPTKSKMRALFN